MPRLRVLTACPGEPEWLPGQVVDATAEQAQQWVDGVHATPVREQQMERATTWR